MSRKKSITVVRSLGNYSYLTTPILVSVRSKETCGLPGATRAHACSKSTVPSRTTERGVKHAKGISFHSASRRVRSSRADFSDRSSCSEAGRGASQSARAKPRRSRPSERDPVNWWPRSRGPANNPPRTPPSLARGLLKVLLGAWRGSQSRLIHADISRVLDCFLVPSLVLTSSPRTATLFR